ncbi:hypothetical protein CLAFUW4_14774 [Fulvia fulva]|uniref:uncharacterized protein n=1 Tax=Passalora fulva TaxID=5499 RepID=UPI0028524A2B|nr:uncharacterized protein CLAFUR5_20388 [Fulvia fulva]KAK4608943.1 hypothetical protein CLAFUR4_14766 [Fulvia fulva]KAK4609798.1 hypothetical protein CLAFUR0_14766 [Fulvia fulva]WMI39105.1 hypothetical protein CLAFUR5_20388 [Fulvia fulva]WPV22449.1 hypothetical protein CLAFUW4_14774 [Fulvia fulva]WPV37364.1 hypothetical protein CLAFUW7_14775 [Fulvia fulva]
MIARQTHQASTAQASLEKILRDQAKNRPSLSSSQGSNYESTPSREDAVIENVLSCVTAKPTRSTLSNDSYSREERIRSFVEYATCIDYQVKPRVGLSQEERQYFARINDWILECHSILLHPTQDDREKSRLINYIWGHVHEPSYRANIRPEYTVRAITRFFQYQVSGKYKGCVWEVMKDRGIGALAHKLSTDIYELIPAVFKCRPSDLGSSVLRHAKSCRDDFFLAVNRPDEVPSCPDAWSYHKQVWFRPNQIGKEIAREIAAVEGKVKVEGKVEAGTCAIM